MKNFPITLDQIRDMFKEEGKTIIAAFDQDIKRLEARIDHVDGKVDILRKEMNQRFDDNDDAHQEILGAIDKMCDRKLKKHCEEKHSFATS